MWSQKNRFLEQNLFGQIYIVEFSIKTDFLIPHSTYSKKKSFHLIEKFMCTRTVLSMNKKVQNVP
jgi:hypothetical protein